MDVISNLLLGAIGGVIGYYIVDGWLALREHRRRINREVDKYL